MAGSVDVPLEFLDGAIWVIPFAMPPGSKARAIAIPVDMSIRQAVEVGYLPAEGDVHPTDAGLTVQEYALDRWPAIATVVAFYKPCLTGAENASSYTTSATTRGAAK